MPATPDDRSPAAADGGTGAAAAALPRGRPALVAPFTILVALVGIGLAWTVDGEPLSDALRVSGLVLLVWCAVAESLGASISFRDSGVDTALNGVAVLIGLAFTPTPELLVSVALGSFIAHLIRTDQWRKVFFNTAAVVLHVGVAAAVLDAVAPPSGMLTIQGGVALVIAVAAADLATLGAVVVVIRLASGERASRAQVLRTWVLSLSVTAVTALLGVTAVWSAAAVPASLAVVATLSFAIAILMQLAANRVERARRLVQLEQAVEAINHSADRSELQRLLLDQARELLEARHATLVRRTPTGTVIIGDAHDADVARRVLEDGQTVRRGRRRHFRLLRPSSEIDVVGVPVGGGDPPEAALIVSGSRSSLHEPDASDVRLLSDLARHAAAAVERHSLIDLLRQEVATTERAARTDALTQLPNRDGLLDALAAGPGEGLLVVARVQGVDDLTAAFGRAVADGLLIEVASRLTTLAGPRRCARLADASFAVWLPALTSPERACEDVESTLSREAVRIDQVDLAVPVLVGAVVLTPDLEPDEVLRRARVALAGAGEGVVTYSEELDAEHARRLQLTRELRDALRTDQLSLHYQPKADLHTGVLVGVEALARWIHPDLGFVSPLEFVGLAERSGTIGDLTAWAIRRACREAAAWAAAGRTLPVAVNLSPRDLLDPSLPPTVAAALEESCLPPELLRLEITESVMVVDPERSRKVVDHLRSTGVSISIDDFGAGYASFGHLRRFAVDELKIDRSLVLELDAHGDAIVRAIVALADELGLKTVAEGVEDETTWKQLAAAGVDACQGWHLAKPMTPSDLDAWITDNPARLNALKV